MNTLTEFSHRSKAAFAPVRPGDYAGLPPAEAYAKIAETRRIRPLPESIASRLIPLNGQMVQSPHEAAPYEAVPLKNADPAGYFHNYADKVGTYNMNNGTLALVTDNGDFLVGSVTRPLIKALESYGYRPLADHVHEDRQRYVPMSNNERFLAPSVQAAFSSLFTQAKPENAARL